MLGPEPAPGSANALGLWFDTRGIAHAMAGDAGSARRTYDAWERAGGNPVEVRARYAIALSIAGLADPQHSTIDLLRDALAATAALDDPALRDLLARGKVRLMLSGHHHAYYAGRHGQTVHISQACLGSGPRRLIGAHAVSPRAYTRFTLGADGRIESDAMLAPGFTERLDLTTLPPFIDAPFGRLERLDLAGADR